MFTSLIEVILIFIGESYSIYPRSSCRPHKVLRQLQSVCYINTFYWADAL